MDLTFTLTGGEIASIVCTAITATGAVACTAVRLLYGNVNRRIGGVAEKLEKTRVEQHNFTRSVFVLLTRLHPDKSAQVVEAMQDAFAEAPRPNGEARRMRSS